MADDERHDPDQKDSSLELPSLRSAFRRRRRWPIRICLPGPLVALLTGAVDGLLVVLILLALLPELDD